jgi:ABC-type glutathione transport system ATPase component
MEMKPAWHEPQLQAPLQPPLQPLLQVRGLDIVYPAGAAVSGFDLDLYPDQTLALVGESGCGKSTVAAAIAGLLPARAPRAAPCALKASSCWARRRARCARCAAAASVWCSRSR